MNAKIGMLFIYIFGATAFCLHGTPVDLLLETKAQEFGSRNELMRPNEYRLAVLPFKQSQANQLIAELNSTGTPLTLASETSTEKRFLSTDSSRILFYEKSNGRFSFFDNGLAVLEATTSEIEAKQKAMLFLSKLIGAEAKNYLIVNQEIEYHATRTSIPHTAFVTYRFVRYIDQRPIVGNRCMVRITLGAQCCLKEFSIDVPALIMERKATRKLSRLAASETLLSQIRNRSVSIFGKEGQGIRRTTVHRIVEAYYPVEQNGIARVLPCFTFTATHSYEDGRTLAREHHLLAKNLESSISEGIIEYE